MKKKYLLLILTLNMTLLSFAQDRGNINLHFGTIIVYQTYSLGYETPNLLKNSEKHQLSPLIRIGGWKSSISEKNTGFQSALGFSYLFGANNHHLEFSNEIVTHFDKGLKGQSTVYIASLYRPFLGYRYQSKNNKFIGRIGFGWKELLQIGIGFKL